jgi:hypothetical protein
MFVLPTVGLGVIASPTGLSFPTIAVFDNESEFITDTSYPDYTIVHAKDTDKLYVWNGSAWVIFNQN